MASWMKNTGMLLPTMAWSAAARMRCLYSAVKRRGLACATTSGSGWTVVLPPVVLLSPSLRSGSLRPTGGNTTGEEEADTWLFFTLGDSFSPCSLIKRREVSHLYWHGGAPKFHEYCAHQVAWSRLWSLSGYW